MPNDDMFSGVPALSDNAGLEQFMSTEALAQLGLNVQPDANQQDQQSQQLQFQQQLPNQQAQQSVNGQQQQVTQPNAQQNVNTNGAQQTPATYTREDVQRIIAQAVQQSQATQQNVFRTQSQLQAQQSVYTPQQQATIKQLIDRGVSLEKIAAAMQQNSASVSQNPQEQALAQRIAAVEQLLQQQAYAQEQNAFISKMETFGDKFGLTEDDLVTFGNAALAKGINISTVSDLETVFRAIYPEQYAIRTQRMANAPTSQIFGGSSTPENPRTMVNKVEDQYVEAFLKQSMPNQYGMQPK